MLEAVYGEIGNADAVLYQPMFVVTHHLFELEGSVDREIEVLHFLEKGALVGRHHRQQARDARAAKHEIHGATPYFRSSAPRVSRFLKCSGRISPPVMEMP